MTILLHFAIQSRVGEVNLKIADFLPEHIPQALQIARENYETEKSLISELPEVNACPDLSALAENGLGVAAFKENKMAVFFNCAGPFAYAFGSTDVVGIFSPMQGNGAR